MRGEGEEAEEREGHEDGEEELRMVGEVMRVTVWWREHGGGGHGKAYISAHWRRRLW